MARSVERAPESSQTRIASSGYAVVGHAVVAVPRDQSWSAGDVTLAGTRPACRASAGACTWSASGLGRQPGFCQGLHQDVVERAYECEDGEMAHHIQQAFAA